jgi:hypothetical protein
MSKHVSLASTVLPLACGDLSIAKILIVFSATFV